MKELLPHLIEWQKRNGYAISFACEATLNIARAPDILAMMREAGFDTIFCGIETPEPEALKAMSKSHNMMVPILEGIETLNSYGMEVVSGIILGLDTDTPETGAAHRRLHRELAHPAADHQPAAGPAARRRFGTGWNARGRLIDDDVARVQRRFPAALRGGSRHVAPLHGESLRSEGAVSPLRVSDAGNAAERLRRPWSRQRLAPRNIRMALTMLSKLIWSVGFRGSYRRAFWSFALPRLLTFQIERVLSVGLVAHHLIMFARDACSGRSNASHYSAKSRGLEIEASLPQQSAAE